MGLNSEEPGPGRMLDAAVEQTSPSTELPPVGHKSSAERFRIHSGSENSRPSSGAHGTSWATSGATTSSPPLTLTGGL